MKTLCALCTIISAMLLIGCSAPPSTPKVSTRQIPEKERLCYEFQHYARNGVDVVFTFGSYGTDFWYDTNVEHHFEIRPPTERVVQYFIPLPPVHNKSWLQVKGDHVYAQLVVLDPSINMAIEDHYWMVVYAPPKGAQKRGHIAFQTYSEEQIHVKSRYVVMVRPKTNAPKPKNIKF